MTDYFQLGDLAKNIVMAILKPIFDLLNLLFGWVMIGINAVLAFITSIYQLLNAISDFYWGTLGQILPAEVSYLILSILVLTIALRAYSFLKDISVLGFKI